MFTGAKLKNIIAVVKPSAALKDAEKPPAKNEEEALGPSKMAKGAVAALAASAANGSRYGTWY